MAYEQFAYSYDRLMEDMPYPQWIRFAFQCWDAHGKPRTVVDLGCGTGNIAIPLAQTGLRVTGIDLSGDMLAVARHKTDEFRRRSSFAQGGSVTWIQQDIREWELPEPVDSVISFCDCLNYLTEEEDLLQAFERTFAGLNEGGTFIFDMHTPAQLKAYAEMQPFLLKDEEISYIWTCELDEERCEIEHDLTLFVKDDRVYRRVDEIHVQRAYDPAWVRERLLDTGFRQADCYGDFTWQPVVSSTQRAFFVAKK